MEGGVPAPGCADLHYVNTWKDNEKCAHRLREHKPTGAGRDVANALSLSSSHQRFDEWLRERWEPWGRPRPLPSQKQVSVQVSASPPLSSPGCPSQPSLSEGCEEGEAAGRARASLWVTQPWSSYQPPRRESPAGLSLCHFPMEEAESLTLPLTTAVSQFSTCVRHCMRRPVYWCIL